MKLDQARAIVQEADLEDLFGDYEEFIHSYVPAVKTLKKSGSKRDMGLAAYGCHQIADVWWMAGAPLRSIRFYQQSFDLLKSPYPISEMARRYVEIGKPVKAEKVARQAHKEFPGNELVRDMILDLSEGHIAAEFKPGDPIWAASEQIARNKLNDALKTLKGVRGKVALLKRAAIYGIKGQPKKAILQWQKLKDTKGDIFIGVDDWFYMTHHVFDDPGFWTVIKSLLPRLKKSTFVHLDSVDEMLREDEVDLKRKLVVSYHLCRTSGDITQAMKLSQQYPKWMEIKELVLLLMRDQ